MAHGLSGARGSLARRRVARSLATQTIQEQTKSARVILRKFVAERFVFTPNPGGGYLFKGDLGLLLRMASPTGTDTRWKVTSRRILTLA
jgi:hypothetical protein